MCALKMSLDNGGIEDLIEILVLSDHSLHSVDSGSQSVVLEGEYQLWSVHWNASSQAITWTYWIKLRCGSQQTVLKHTILVILMHAKVCKSLTQENHSIIIHYNSAGDF